ncbi:MAG: dimethylmenaquinone methyltransferase [Propionibacteriales bacterium]|nr:dimethylmenaquinone methyltransferase [Propionibacteriales bacterium]
MNRQVAELGRAGVATVYEAYGRRGLIAQEWDVVTTGRRVAGPACTVRCGDGDNRAVHEAMSLVRPGELLVITMDTPQPVGVVGDLLVTQAAAQGAVGILVNAAVRDSADLAGSQLAVLTRWRSVRGATRTARGEINVPVSLGGTTIQPGDVVVLDDDGAAVVSAVDVDDTVAAVRKRIAREAELRARWESGELSYDVYGLRQQDAEESVTT